MNDLPRQQLCKLIANYGRSLCDDPQRCEALLKDLCRGQYGREIYALVDALKERVAADLLASQNSVSPEVLLSRLAKRLRDNRPLAEDAALWAVESWALALGVSLPPVPPEDPENTPEEDDTTTWKPPKPPLWKVPLGILAIAVVVGVIVSHHPKPKHSKPLLTTAPSPVENTPSPSISETQQPSPTGSSPSASPNPIESSPSENAEFFNRRGVDKYDRKDYTGAIADYNQAIQLNPNYADAYNNRGNVRHELGDKQAAIADYNQAIQLNPNYADAYGNRGDARSELGEYQAAIADSETAANLYYQQGEITAYKAASIQVSIRKQLQQLNLSVLHNKGRN